jgi:predicted extracellular nuclease
MARRSGPNSIARVGVTVGALLAASFAVSLPATTAQAAGSTSVVISQVYGGGGNSGATYKNDFIELYNIGGSSVGLTGWSVQYASATGSSWNRTNLSGTVEPGHYYLVQEAAGFGGTTQLPAPDATGTIAMSATDGKVALVSNTTALSGACPTSASIVDFVGFGSANCSETAPTPKLSNTTAALRNDGGATDTDNNAADFTVGAPLPRNSLWPITQAAQAAPNLLQPGEQTLLTVAVTFPSGVPSTGGTVTCDLSPIGGAATQGLSDDGTNGDVAAGDGTFSFRATVGSDIPAGAYSLSCTYADAEGHVVPSTIALTVVVITPIGAVNGPVGDSDNGATHESPFKGQTVSVQGVVYEKTLQATDGSGTYKGFYLQNTSATADTDPTTSDGLFVYMGTSSTVSGPDGNYPPKVGDEVILTGKVSEYYNMTELVAPLAIAKVVRSGVNIDEAVPPVEANPPTALAEANRYWERLQGMRVQVPQNSIVLGGRNVFSPADAEIWVARPDSTIAQRTAAYERRAFRDAHPLDDNYDPANWDGNGYRILMGSLGLKGASGNAQTLITPARTFDTLNNAPAGGLNYTYSKYRIEVTEQPTFGEGPDPAANNPPTVVRDANHYTVVDYNLENLYDYRDNPFSGCDFNGGDNTGCSNAGTPYFSSITPSYDYVPASAAAYQARLTDIATQIIDDLHSPDVLMVQEVENQDICGVTDGELTCGNTDNADGKPDVLQDLALKIASLGGPAYDAAFDRDSSDLRGIAPAFLYRTDRVELLPAAGDPVLGTAPQIGDYTSVPYDSDVSNPKALNAPLPTGISACESRWVFPRAVDVALFRIYSTSIGVGSHRDVYLLNNHFKSGPDTCVAHRTEQANYDAALVRYLEAANPDARIVLGGDLNIYPRPDDIGLGSAATDQLGALYDPALGLQNLWEVLLDQAPEAAYSYVYLGMAQTLDQMFVNQAMRSDLAQFRIAHINSDFPADYPGDVARGTSDHDPNVAAFEINDPPTVSAGGPYHVTEGGSITLTAAGTDPEGQPLSYAWDLDHDGTFETTGKTATFSAAGLTAPSTHTVTVRVTDSLGATATDDATVYVHRFTWRPPLHTGTNVAQAGSAIPVKFSLGGYLGMDVIADGYPVSGSSSDPIATLGGLQYDAATDTYTLVWKTDKNWAGTTRDLVLMLFDGTTHKVTVEFAK